MCTLKKIADAVAVKKGNEMLGISLEGKESKIENSTAEYKSILPPQICACSPAISKRIQNDTKKGN